MSIVYRLAILIIVRYIQLTTEELLVLLIFARGKKMGEREDNIILFNWRITVVIDGARRIIWMSSAAESEAHESIARYKIILRATEKSGNKPLSVVRVKN